MCQCLAEMFGLNIDHLLYITYSEESTTFFKVKFSQELWNLVWDQALEDFGTDWISKPTRNGIRVKDINLQSLMLNFFVKYRHVQPG